MATNNEKLKEVVAKGLITPEFEKLVRIEAAQNPAFHSMLHSTMSGMIPSLIFCQQMNLSPVNAHGECYFHTKNNRVVPFIGYKGLVQMIHDGSQNVSITTETVHEEDVFKFTLGLNPDLQHTPSDPIRTSKTLTDIYVIIKGFGDAIIKVFSRLEIENMVNAMESPSGLYWNDQKDPQMWMLKKTCLKQAAKLIPKKSALKQSIAIDDRMEGGGSLALDAESNELVINEDKPTKLAKGSIYTAIVGGNLFKKLDINEDSANIALPTNAAEGQTSELEEAIKSRFKPR